jgi:hypothetical protein
MADRAKARRSGHSRKTLEQVVQATGMIRRGDFRVLSLAGNVSQRECRVGQPNAVDSSRKNAHGRGATAKKGELEAR